MLRESKADGAQNLMVIGKDSNLPFEDIKKGGTAGAGEAAAAQGRFQDELAATRGLAKGTSDAVQVAANDVQIAQNGLPTSDPIAQQLFRERIAPHMHGPQSPADAGVDPTTGRRPVANSADMEAGLFGPKSAQNSAQYNSVLQDFHTLDANFKKELSAHGLNGPAADQMRKFLYFSNNANQRDQFLKSYNLTLPQGFNEFEQKYGQKASRALHWAMEQP